MGADETFLSFVSDGALSEGELTYVTKTLLPRYVDACRRLLRVVVDERGCADPIAEATLATLTDILVKYTNRVGKLLLPGFISAASEVLSGDNRDVKSGSWHIFSINVEPLLFIFDPKSDGFVAMRTMHLSEKLGRTGAGAVSGKLQALSSFAPWQGGAQLSTVQRHSTGLTCSVLRRHLTYGSAHFE